MSAVLAMVHAKLMPNAWSASFCRRKAAAVMEPGCAFAICGLRGLVLSQCDNVTMACVCAGSRPSPVFTSCVRECDPRLKLFSSFKASSGWIRIRSVLLSPKKPKCKNLNIFQSQHFGPLIGLHHSSFFWEEGVKFYHFLYDDFFLGADVTCLSFLFFFTLVTQVPGQQSLPMLLQLWSETKRAPTLQQGLWSAESWFVRCTFNLTYNIFILYIHIGHIDREKWTAVSEQKTLKWNQVGNKIHRISVQFTFVIQCHPTWLVWLRMCPSIGAILVFYPHAIRVAIDVNKTFQTCRVELMFGHTYMFHIPNSLWFFACQNNMQWFCTFSEILSSTWYAITTRASPIISIGILAHLSSKCKSAICRLR